MTSAVLVPSLTVADRTLAPSSKPKVSIPNLSDYTGKVHHLLPKASCPLAEPCALILNVAVSPSVKVSLSLRGAIRSKAESAHRLHRSVHHGHHQVDYRFLLRGGRA